MTTPPYLSEKQILEVRLGILRREHRDLDEAIAALGSKAHADQLTLKRLKKRKLALKDEITRIEDRITPDIIA